MRVNRYKFILLILFHWRSYFYLTCDVFCMSLSDTYVSPKSWSVAMSRIFFVSNRAMFSPHVFHVLFDECRHPTYSLSTLWLPSSGVGMVCGAIVWCDVAIVCSANLLLRTYSCAKLTKVVKMQVSYSNISYCIGMFRYISCFLSFHCPEPWD